MRNGKALELLPVHFFSYRIDFAYNIPSIVLQFCDAWSSCFEVDEWEHFSYVVFQDGRTSKMGVLVNESPRNDDP